jgi:hypothetical protein
MGREELIAELKAIEKWDFDFYNSNLREKAALDSFLTRQNRRREILKELGFLPKGIDDTTLEWRREGGKHSASAS